MPEHLGVIVVNDETGVVDENKLLVDELIFDTFGNEVVVECSKLCTVESDECLSTDSFSGVRVVVISSSGGDVSTKVTLLRTIQHLNSGAHETFSSISSQNSDVIA